ncbi:type II secretion system F family protein [Undibacterium flavidum]|uniref:Type II secretion system F family protein n=1 Tax=Undibacterium flavidum TaxID=2762297 RepID=A0ABR6YB79_9BURK|nr:type II secretion system F family protein [Undibacterium flavidum]MBC3873833.1 type II secretion system F family protein [Undibacterium flavidum]
MQFLVRTFDVSSGVVIERMMEGEEPLALQQMLEREGVTVLSVVGHHSQFLVKRKSNFNVVLFCEELRTLLSSGMSLVEAIETLCAKKDGGNKHAVLLEIQQRLLEGKPFSAAIESNQFIFPVLLVASIKASERTSRIEDALDEYIAYEKLAQELGRKIVSAAIYPSLVVGFGMLVCLFMISYVVPRFAKVYEDFSQSLSMSTILLMRLGQFVGDHIFLLLGGVLCVVAAAFVGYKNGKLKSLFLRSLGRFKFAQYYLRLYQLARIYQTMSMLLKGGYTLSDAIPLAQNLAFDEKLKNQVINTRSAIQEGKRLSTAFVENGLTDSVTERMLIVGERSGNLATILDIIAQAYRQEFTLFIERATRLAEPVLLMLVGLMVGAIIILMYMPVFDLAGGI